MLRSCSIVQLLVIFLLRVKGFYGSEVGVYVALQGDLHLTIRADRWWNSSSPHSHSHKAVARIVDHFNVTIAQKSFFIMEQVANVTFGCGSVIRAGNYRVDFTIDKRTVDHVHLKVVWPPVIVQAPAEMYNYRSPFQVKIQWVHLKCYPTKKEEISVSAEIIHCGRRNTSCSFQWLQQVRSSIPVTDVWQTQGIVDVRFGCQSLSRPGFYRIALRAKTGDVIDSDDIIGASGMIHVMTNTDFQMQIRSRYALPCRSQLLVFYRHPACTGSSDRIRLYAKIYSNVSAIIARPFRMDYIGERPLVPDHNIVAFSCPSVEHRVFDALCFRYVNIADDKSVTEISETCIPSHKTSAYIEPNWGIWSKFSACTSKCGDGIRYRYRFCDSPSPRHIGSFCSGNPIEVHSCQQSTCLQVPTTRSPLEQSSIPTSADDLTATCRCGCKQKLRPGNSSFTLAASSRMCYQERITWILTVSSHNQIQIDFNYLRLDCHADIVLTIRDGRTTYSPLIEILDSQTKTETLATVVTTSSEIFLELNTSYLEEDDEFLQCVTGFIASVQVVPNNITTQYQVISGHQKPSEVQSTVIAITSMLLIVAGGVAILSAVYSKCGLQYRHRIKTKDFKGSFSDFSGLSEASEYQLLSITTITSVAEDASPEEIKNFESTSVTKLQVSNSTDQIKSRDNRPQKSLPNSPLIGIRRDPRARLSLFSQSASTIILRGSHHLDRFNSIKNGTKCSIYSLNDSGQVVDSSQGIEMSLIKADSEITLKFDREEKVLNTKFLHVSSSEDTCTSFTKSTVSFATASVSDQEFELDYYDLDVRNTGDAPDSFLRCLDDDSIYWDDHLITALVQDIQINSTNSVTTSLTDSTIIIEEDE